MKLFLAAQRPKEPFRILDLGGPGIFNHRHNSERAPIYAGLPSLEGRKIEIVSINNNNEADVSYRASNCTIIQKTGRVPYDLASETGGHYDHIHMHMITAKFGENTLNQTISEINRMLKPGGLFFTCADSSLISQDQREKLRLGADAMKLREYVRELLLSFFKPVYYDLEREEGYKISKSEARRIIGAIGFFDCGYFKSGEYAKVAAAVPVGLKYLFDHFSHDANYAYYLAIMEKPRTRLKTVPDPIQILSKDVSTQ